MVNARNKGSSGEREACAWLEKYIWESDVGLERNLNQSRDGGADIIRHPFSFEIKRRKGNKNLGIEKWWAQARKAADKLNSDENTTTYIPIVMFRIDRGQWEFLIPSDVLVSNTPRWIRMDRFTFKAWAKVYMRHA